MFIDSDAGRRCPLCRISEDSMTMMLSEQNIHWALGFAEHACVIESGITILDGTRATLLNNLDFSNKFWGLE